ncbi:hypothetical protein NDU88_009621 [Pleurodeles waltl]|uniref:Uncharacterized protein n=1 Tax=Pleurodeles waltl TaxID=8319 RepID=A0AAV7S081_PLEWA|nr:hypothetical protein NDU88_009621 [Pleurodeles waltl]
MYSLPRRKSPLALRHRKLPIGLLVERQSRTGPVRPHTLSAVRAGGTSLQGECFTSLPVRQQAVAPQSAWGPVGALRVAQGEPSEFGSKRASVTGLTPGPSREHEPQSAHRPRRT